MVRAWKQVLIRDCLRGYWSRPGVTRTSNSSWWSGRTSLIMQAKEKARWGLRLVSFSSFKIGSCLIVQLLVWPGDLSLPCCCLILCWGVCTLLAFCSPDLWSCWPSLKIYSGQWPDCVVKLRHWQDLWSGNTGGAQAWFAGATTVHGPYQGDCITGVTLAIWVGTVKKK